MKGKINPIGQNTTQQEKTQQNPLKQRLIKVKISESDLIQLFKDNKNLKNLKNILYFSIGNKGVLNPSIKRDERGLNK